MRVGPFRAGVQPLVVLALPASDAACNICAAQAFGPANIPCVYHPWALCTFVPLSVVCACCPLALCLSIIPRCCGCLSSLGVTHACRPWVPRFWEVRLLFVLHRGAISSLCKFFVRIWQLFSVFDDFILWAVLQQGS